MSRKSFRLCTLILAGVLISFDGSYLMAANIRSFIEAVRRKAAVVYVGSVKEVRLLERSKFDIKARAFINILTVVRGPTNSREATVDYSSPCWMAVHNIDCGPAPWS